MPNSDLLPTPALERQISAYIRAGGFPHVAAEAAGVPARAFERWLRRGHNPRRDPAYRTFAGAVRAAAAQARLRAEIAALEGKPLDWLRYGPGKETAGRPGWTAAARAAADTGREVNALDVPEIRALFAKLLPALADHRALRESVLEAMTAPKPPRRGPVH
jgi:hypothetical protein